MRVAGTRMEARNWSLPRLRRGVGVLVAGALGVLACSSVGAQEPERELEAAPGDSVPSVEALPGSLDLLISVHDLTTMRTRAGGQALMAFLGEVGEWGRSTSALTDLGLALDLRKPAGAACVRLSTTACTVRSLAK